MMEQAYGTTEDQIREVKSIARRFLGKTQNYQGFSKSFKTSVEEQVNKKVLGLLQEEKPKVLVYGIYNAGKSTLVNVLCGKEVAEVGDRPTTAKTQPYDAGKYILMDTPGSDAPIEVPNPLVGIYAAVTRRNVGETHDGYNPQEKVSRFEAVRLYTVGAAEIIGQHHIRGKIAAGYAADFTILQEDLFHVEIEHLPQIQVACTVVDGKIVYENRCKG